MELCHKGGMFCDGRLEIEEEVVPEYQWKEAKADSSENQIAQ